MFVYSPFVDERLTFGSVSIRVEAPPICKGRFVNRLRLIFVLSLGGEMLVGEVREGRDLLILGYKGKYSFIDTVTRVDDFEFGRRIEH